MNTLGAFLSSLRPRQWTKNLLLFAGILFTQRYDDPRLAANAVAAFLVFCALSGVVYIINDIVDRETDREHPKKRFRPIASGRISPAAAGTGAVVLLAVALTAAWLITLPFFVTSVIYVLLITAYSFHLKHVALLDVLVLALGFVVRALAGLEALRVPEYPPLVITPYFVMTTLFLALFLAVAKRRNELVLLGEGAGEHRRVLEQYSTGFLDQMLTIATAGVIFSYAAWATLGDFALVDETYAMAFTMPFVLYGVFRYLWLVYHRDEGGAPEVVLLTDRPMQVTILLWTATTVALLAMSR